jgi:hypothetical protein
MRGGGVEDDVDVENVPVAIAIAKWRCRYGSDDVVLMTCDDEKCDLDDELKAALFVVKSFVASDLSGEHDEGVSGINRAVELRAQLWLARASVIRVRRSARVRPQVEDHNSSNLNGGSSTA